MPFALIFTKLFGFGDIRNIGSGNVGATNVLRTGNKVLAFSVLCLDIFKGFLPFLVLQIFFKDINLLNMFNKLISLKNICKTRKGRKPLKISRQSTEKAKTLLPVLKTLVAPTFPEPIFLISPKPNNFVKINAKGIEPIK